jgi:hypothetical protein
VILHCSFEELAAATTGAQRVLEEEGGGGAGVLAPPEVIADLEALLPRLDGDIEVTTLADQRSILRALDAILVRSRTVMDHTILEQYVGAEDAVVAYFDYAHVLVLRDRAAQLGHEMSALIELLTGSPPTPETTRHVIFD